MGKSKRFEYTYTMGARVNYTRQKSWNTRPNKIRQVRAPGGRLVAQYVGKRSKGPQTAITTSDQKLGGVAATRPSGAHRIAKHRRTVTRAYGGVLTHTELRQRIIRTFLTEEVKNVKKTMLLAQAAESKKNKKGGKGKGGAKRKQTGQKTVKK